MSSRIQFTTTSWLRAWIVSKFERPVNLQFMPCRLLLFRCNCKSNPMSSWLLLSFVNNQSSYVLSWYLWSSIKVDLTKWLHKLSQRYVLCRARSISSNRIVRRRLYMHGKCHCLKSDWRNVRSNLPCWWLLWHWLFPKKTMQSWILQRKHRLKNFLFMY